MKKTVLTIVAIACSFSSFALDETAFKETFNDGLRNLTLGRTAKALPLFRQLYEVEPQNANINYLLGICYAEEGLNPEKSIMHLEAAEKKMVKDYMVHSYKENRVPIYVYFYMSLAYAQNGDCQKAIKAKEHFFSHYNVYAEDDRYMERARQGIADCINMPEPQEIDTMLLAEELATVDETADIGTKIVQYTVRTPLYGVQVGAYREADSKEAFAGLKNTEAFMDNHGMIRYVVGKFGLKSQAEGLRSILAQEGYADAFVVDINKEQKFSDEVLNINNLPESLSMRERIDLRVQVGAFREQISAETAGKYLKVDGIEETHCNDLTVMTVGSYKTYEDAAAQRDALIKSGIKDAFVAGFNKDQKIPIKEALKFLGSK